METLILQRKGQCGLTIIILLYTYQTPASRTYLENSVSERDGLGLCGWPLPATGIGPAPPATTTLIGPGVPPPGLHKHILLSTECRTKWQVNIDIFTGARVCVMNSASKFESCYTCLFWQISHFYNVNCSISAFSALTPLVGWQEEHPADKKLE